MKFEHILFPIDFSERTELLVPAVEAIANRFGSQVTLFHVFEIPAAWYGNADAPLINTDCLKVFSESAKRRLDDFRIQIPESRLQRVIAEGETAAHIADWAKDNGVDLIMMGTHGYGRVRGLLLGSVTAKVLHDTACPVWTDSLLHAPAGSRTRGVSNILCAVDAGEEGVDILRFVAGIAKEFQADVQVVHAVPGAEAPPSPYSGSALQRFLMDTAEEELARQQRAAGTNFPTLLRRESISKAVAETALQTNCDLVVIGRGKTREGLARLRTQAYQILRDAPCPVVSFSAPHREETSPSPHAASSESMPAEVGAGLLH